MEIRTKGLIEELTKHEDAHLIVLQEVTQNIYETLLKQAFIRKFHVVTIDPSFGPCFIPYGNVILSKFPFIERPELCLYDITKKTFLSAKIMLNGRKCSIFALHLKAGSFKTDGELRKKQLEFLISLQKEFACEEMLMIGDFNYRESEGEEDSIEGYKDFWLEVNKDPEQKCWTFDEFENKMANNIAVTKFDLKKKDPNLVHKLEQRRYDRLFYSSDYWIPQNLSIIAKQKLDTIMVEQNPTDIFISDHFGVSFVFKSSK